MLSLLALCSFCSNSCLCCSTCICPHFHSGWYAAITTKSFILIITTLSHHSLISPSFCHVIPHSLLNIIAAVSHEPQLFAVFLLLNGLLLDYLLLSTLSIKFSTSLPCPSFLLLSASLYYLKSCLAFVDFT